MNGSIIWKLVLSCLVFVWAVTSITPVQNTPFEDYIRQEAKAKLSEFDSLLSRAAQQAEAGQSPSTFVALGEIVRQERIDLAAYFPHLDVSEERNLNRRNEILLTELLRRSQGKLKLGLDLAGGVAVTFRVDSQANSDEGEDSLRDTSSFGRQAELEQARSIIAERVDTLGVAEPVIRLKGDDRIEVQMPGISTKDNPDIIDVIGKPALLEFSVVHPTANPEFTQEAPLGYIRMAEEIEQTNGEIIERAVYVKRIPEMTGSDVRSARAVPNEFGGYRVMLNFTDEGSTRFADVTRRLAEEGQQTGRPGQLAIILDGKLYSAPTVREAITGGSAEITGRFSQREALDLANVLNNPLEVGLVVDEMYEVGPSLASGARDASIMAAIIGAALVVIFMVGYYWAAGVIAIVAVAFNILFVLGWLAYFGATITLPGVAALVLTIGMAVDANILILERIREELKAGKQLQTAVTTGFNKAFSTIVDANITTLITAGLLAWLGTGPVKGFGVTLAIGIFGTLFSALIVSRWITELVVSKGLLKRVLGMAWIKEPSFEFLEYRKKAFAISGVTLAIGVIAVALHWNNIFGIDFIGGDEVTLSYEQQLTVADITAVNSTDMATIEQLAGSGSEQDVGLRESFNAVISNGGFGDVSAQFQSIIGSDRETVVVQTLPGQGPAFAQALAATNPDAGFDVLGVMQVGPSVGAEVTTSALISIVLAVIGILLYVAIRFEWGFGVGAVVSTIHDGVITIGLFVALGEFFGIGSGQFTAPMIAAILMVLGYSINDTIVVFDRIREELELNPGMDLKKVVHLAINRTLSRTLLTSITTLLATLSLFIFAAGVIVDFSLIFIVGILTGTFSSIFIATPVFYWYHKGDRRKVEERHVLPTYDWHTSEEAKTAKS